jgi:wobble nucleotide-excising tRNase
MKQVIDVLNIAEANDRETDRYNALEYIFIDDPVSSLDDTHLIELAVNVAELIKSSESPLKFIITTHNPLFYNVLFNEFNRVKGTIKKRLEKLDDGSFLIVEQPTDSPFSYHLHLFSELESASQSGAIQKYHFNFLRNLFEKTSTFLGYNKWEDLLPQEARGAYYKRIINLSSHSKHHGEETSIIEEGDKRVMSYLIEVARNTYGFKSTVNAESTEGNVAV